MAWRRWPPRKAANPVADDAADDLNEGPEEESAYTLDLFGALADLDDDIEIPAALPVKVDRIAAPEPAERIHEPVAPVESLVTDALRSEYGLHAAPKTTLEARPYQEDAIAAWARADGRGLIVLPTGAGKTVVALLIAARLGLRTLVVVPTIDLLRQWREQIADRLGYPLSAVGIIGGGQRTVRDITVITYDSAAMPRRKLDGFGLLIVDEAHHLPAPAFQSIAPKVNAPFRLGLSATPERNDGAHVALDRLIGPIVYRQTASTLSEAGYIAKYAEKRIFVDLSPQELLTYEQLMGEYRFYVATHRASLGPPAMMFTELIRRAGSDPAARSALRVHHQARMMALNADAKIAQVAQLLEKHRDDKVIVFSEYTAMVDLLSEKLLLPAITYRMPPAERRDTLARFRSGEYSKIVTGRVLNEGVDVPDANVAIIASGSATARDYIQRLGRVLRPKASEAVLYEIITRKTTEGRASRQRRKAA